MDVDGFYVLSLVFGIVGFKYYGYGVVRGL